MKKNRYLLPVLLCVLLLPAIPGQTADDVVGDWLKSNVYEDVLPNGVRVLALDRGYAPVLALLISFRVGSADESYESTGTAHMLEHMMFKGTETIGTNNYSAEKKILDEIEAVGATIDHLRREGGTNPLLPQMLERLKKLQQAHSEYTVLSPYSTVYTALGGVNFNAGTSRDQTVYYIELPAESLETWARLESERLRAPVFRQYYLERDAVMEERRMRYDSVPSAKLTEQFLFTVFASHPYRHPVIGWESVIATLPLDTVRDFYYTNYVPSRMTITIVGKQNVAGTMELVRRYFAACPHVRLRRHLPRVKSGRRVNGVSVLTLRQVPICCWDGTSGQRRPKRTMSVISFPHC
jgi:predicted Zn-dependent peptidase